MSNRNKILGDNDHGYVPLVVNTSRSFPHSLITGFVTRLTRRVALVEQELLTLPQHLSSPPVFTGVRVTRSLVLYVCFVDRCLSFCTFSFGHCVVCSSSIYGFWLPLWYLQTLLKDMLDCAQKYLLLLDQTILLHFRSSIDRPLNLPQYPSSKNYFSIPEENI
jgi:hypothetical protein